MQISNRYVFVLVFIVDCQLDNQSKICSKLRLKQIYSNRSFCMKRAIKNMVSFKQWGLRYEKYNSSSVDISFALNMVCQINQNDIAISQTISTTKEPFTDFAGNNMKWVIYILLVSIRQHSNFIHTGYDVYKLHCFFHLAKVGWEIGFSNIRN